MTSKGIDDAYKKILGKKGFSVIDPDSRYEFGDEPSEVEKYDDPTGVDDFKRKAWRDESGRLHRDNGPALIIIDIEEQFNEKEQREYVTTKIYGYYQHGKLHRLDGPAKIRTRGADTVESSWYLNGKLHRENGPAVYRKEFTYKNVADIYEWWVHGVKQKWVRTLKKWGTTFYDANNQKHRDDGPADVTKSPYVDVITINWFKHGKRHRIDGPAVLKRSTDHPGVNTGFYAPEYWINGQKYTKEEFENYFKDTSEGDKDLLSDLGQSFD